MNEDISKHSTSDEEGEPKVFLRDLMKGFLYENTSRDGRKKMYDNADILSDSSVERKINELDEIYDYKI